jgi:hypothetical protein
MLNDIEDCLFSLHVHLLPYYLYTNSLSFKHQGVPKAGIFKIKTKKEPVELAGSFCCLATSYSRRGKAPTTLGAEELNFRVRNGNGCDLFAIITRPI